MKGFLKGTGLTLVLLLGLLWFVSQSGLRMLAVTSGSMEPALPVGSAVFIFPCSFEEIRAGDVMTFQLGSSLVTHRVIEKEQEGLITKGDANGKEDGGIVSPSQVVGRVVFCIPYLGKLFFFCEGEGRRLMLLYLGFFLLVMMLIEGLRREEHAMEKR